MGRVGSTSSRRTRPPKCPHAFSPDGQLLVYTQTDPGMGRGIGTLSVEGEETAELLIQTAFDEGNPALSPDGQWIAYQSNESGQFEVVVRPFPNIEAGRWQFSSGGGQEPVWSPDGRELFYRDQGGGQVLSAPVQTDPTFQPGNPEVLFEGQYYPARGRTYDIAPDGQRFLMIKEGTETDDTSAAGQIIIVENWFEELKARVPVN